MLTTLVLAATEGANPGMLEHFGIELKYVVAQLIGFSIFATVIYFKAIKPTIGAMAERQAAVDVGIKHAEEMKTKLDAAAVESVSIVKAAQAQATKVIEEARISAKAVIERQSQEATVKAQGIIAKAQHATELEHRKMIAEARGEIARLVIATTRQVLAQELSNDDRTRYNNAAAKELSIS